VLEVLEPAELPAVLDPVVPRLSLAVPEELLVDVWVLLVPDMLGFWVLPLAVLEDASDEPSGRFVSVEPDVDVDVEAVEAGGGSGVLGGLSLPPPPQLAAPRRRTITELIAIRFMKTSRVMGA